VPDSHPDDQLALTLFSTWSVLTGRTLRAARPDDLTEEELIEFWQDASFETTWGVPASGPGRGEPG
jgi:hypothetical protein